MRAQDNTERVIVVCLFLWLACTPRSCRKDRDRANSWQLEHILWVSSRPGPSGICAHTELKESVKLPAGSCRDHEHEKRDLRGMDARYTVTGASGSFPSYPR